MRALSSIVVVCLVAAASVRPVDADELVRASNRVRVETVAKASAHRAPPASGSVRWRANGARLDSDRGSGPSLSPALVVVAFAIPPADTIVDLVPLVDSRLAWGREVGSSSARGPPTA
jgi:hypothetical protein